MDYLGISAIIATVVAIIAALVLLRDGGVRDGKIGRFFHFDSFSIEGLVKFAYLFGAVLLVVVAVFDVIEGVSILSYYGTTYMYYLFYYLGEGVLVLVAGEVVLRIVAELVMIFVNVAEDIHALREELEEDDEELEDEEDELAEDEDVPEALEAADEPFYDEDEVEVEEAAETAEDESDAESEVAAEAEAEVEEAAETEAE